MATHVLVDEALEWAEEVTGQPRLGTCKFTEICDLLPPGTVWEPLPYEKKLFNAKGAVLSRRCHCETHKADCVVGKGIDFVCSGLPCTDMSTAGLRQKRHGPTAGVYISHGKFNTQHRTPLILVECTQDPSVK